METHYLLNNFQRAFEFGEKSTQHLQYIRGFYIETAYYLFFALSIMAVFNQFNYIEKGVYLLKLTHFRNKLRQYAKISPRNHMHFYLLMEAEWARFIHKSTTIIEEKFLYAIKIASKRPFIQYTALIHERFANYLMSQNKKEAAEFHFTEAKRNFMNWGILFN